MTFSFPPCNKKIELPNHQKLFQTQYGVRNCFPTPVLADRSRGQVLPFSTCSVPSQTHIKHIQLKKDIPCVGNILKNTVSYLSAPYVGISQQVQRVRFYLLNYTVVPLLG